MICYDCARDSVTNDAVAICSVCSAGICRKHAEEAEKPITVTRLLNRSDTLPKKARSFRCHHCDEALEQPVNGSAVFAESRRGV